jgi:hypothetical protein
MPTYTPPLQPTLHASNADGFAFSNTIQACCDFNARVAIYPPIDYCANGIAKVYVAGGVPPFTYAFLNAHSISPTLPFNNNLSARWLRPGSYVVRVKDSRGCEIIIDFVIPQPPKWKIIYETRDYCRNGNNQNTVWGRIRLTGVEGAFQSGFQFNYRLTRYSIVTSGPNNGQLITQQPYNGYAGTGMFPLTFEPLEPGTYMLEINNGVCEQRLYIKICSNCNQGITNQQSTEQADSGGECDCGCNGFIVPVTPPVIPPVNPL